jgi:hypothetical protein
VDASQKYKQDDQVKKEGELEEPTSGISKIEFFPGRQDNDTKSDLAICQ